MGCDPGISGAIAILNSAGDLVVVDMRVTIEKLASGKTRKRVDPVALATILRPYTGCKMLLEHVWSRPGGSCTGAFAFGECFGLVRGVAAALGIEVTLITPPVWRKRIGLIGEGGIA